MADAINAEKKPFHWRGLTSLVVTLAFLVLATTGVILYVSPQGRVANWTGWNVWGLSKEEWAAAHTTAALLFLVASGFHIYFNWNTLVCYVVRRRRLNLKREMIGAAAVVAAVFVGTVVGIPPLSGIADLNDRIKAHWEGRSEQAPYPHAEASTLADFSEKTGIPLATLVERLARAGITVDDPASQTLEGLARAHDATIKLIECICTDEAQLRERVERRGDWANYEQERAAFERLNGPRLIVDTAEPVLLNLRKVMTYLGRGIGESRNP